MVVEAALCPGPVPAIVEATRLLGPVRVLPSQKSFGQRLSRRNFRAFLILSSLPFGAISIFELIIQEHVV